MVSKERIEGIMCKKGKFRDLKKWGFEVLGCRKLMMMNEKEVDNREIMVLRREERKNEGRSWERIKREIEEYKKRIESIDIFLIDFRKSNEIEIGEMRKSKRRILEDGERRIRIEIENVIEIERIGNIDGIKNELRGVLMWIRKEGKGKKGRRW